MDGEFKYPRTPHLPQSPGATSDDKWASEEAIRNLSSGIDLVVTEKMDGGNVTLARDYFHARSLSSSTPACERRAKAEWANLRHDIPEGWRLSCESMWARRSVPYDDLPGPLLLIGVWDASNRLVSWDTTVEWSQLIGIPTVPVIARGDDFLTASRAWAAQGLNEEISEGFVIRSAGTVAYDDFALNVAKWVRSGHVRTDASWRHRDDFAVNGMVS